MSVPLSVRPWVSSDSQVHIRQPGTGRTLCGLDVGPATSVSPRKACEACTGAAVADYARAHRCGRDCQP